MSKHRESMTFVLTAGQTIGSDLHPGKDEPDVIVPPGKYRVLSGYTFIEYPAASGVFVKTVPQRMSVFSPCESYVSKDFSFQHGLTLTMAECRYSFTLDTYWKRMNNEIVKKERANELSRFISLTGGGSPDENSTGGVNEDAEPGDPDAIHSF